MTSVDFFFSEGIQNVFKYDSQNLLVYHPKIFVVAMVIIMAAKYPLKCAQSVKKKRNEKKSFHFSWKLSTVPLVNDFCKFRNAKRKCTNEIHYFNFILWFNEHIIAIEKMPII